MSKEDSGILMRRPANCRKSDLIASTTGNFREHGIRGALADSIFSPERVSLCASGRVRGIRM